MKKSTWPIAVASFILSVLLMATAICNAYLWRGDNMPPNELSRTILSVQALCILPLLLLIPINFTLGVIHFLNKNRSTAYVSLAAFALTVVAMVFTMVVDSASLFVQ